MVSFLRARSVMKLGPFRSRAVFDGPVSVTACSCVSFPGSRQLPVRRLPLWLATSSPVVPVSSPELTLPLTLTKPQISRHQQHINRKLLLPSHLWLPAMNYEWHNYWLIGSAWKTAVNGGGVTQGRVLGYLRANTHSSPRHSTSLHHVQIQSPGSCITT